MVGVKKLVLTNSSHPILTQYEHCKTMTISVIWKTCNHWGL